MFNNNNESVRTSAIEEAQRIEEDSLYSARGHFEAARAWSHLHLWIGIPTTITAAIAGISALNSYPVLSGVLSLFVAAFSALNTFLNPNARANLHSKAGNSFNSLRNDARIFRNIDCQSSENSIPEKLHSLNERRNTLNIESPQIPRFAYLRGRKRIQDGESSYKIDSIHK